MGELGSALDTLEADDLFAFTPAGVLERTATIVEAINRLQAQLARTVRHGDATQAAEHDGKASMASWLRGHHRFSPAALGQLKRIGRAMEHLPAVAAGFAAGLISADQVAVCAPVTSPENLERAAAQGIDLGEIAAVFAEVAMTQQYPVLGRTVHHYLSRLDTDGPEPDPTEGRSLTLVKHADGSVTGRFALDVLGGEKLQSVIESYVQAGRCAGDLRNRAQQQADALVQWADNTLAAGSAPILRTVKPHLLITAGVENIAGGGPAADGACPVGDASSAAFPDGSWNVSPAAQTAFGAYLTAAQLRWAACDTVITRVLIDDDGVPIHHGRTKRVASAQLRRTVVAADRHCIFAGCEAPHYWCDVHHVLHWLDDGETCPENSGLLCERHHTKVHHGFRVERDSTGRWRTYRPDGSEIVIYEPLIA
jgi:hypothetical protein